MHCYILNTHMKSVTRYLYSFLNYSIFCRSENKKLRPWKDDARAICQKNPCIFLKERLRYLQKQNCISNNSCDAVQQWNVLNNHQKSSFLLNSFLLLYCSLLTTASSTAVHCSLLTTASSTAVHCSLLIASQCSTAHCLLHQPMMNSLN